MSPSDPAPALYIPHGGGPLPLLGDPAHGELVSFLKRLGKDLPTPRAILVVSAHWEEAVATVMSSERPPLLFDYYGFPPESYEYRYPAPGSPAVAARVLECLERAGIECRSELDRGLDHGVFVPLMLMYPQADVPCLQLSLLDSLDPASHLALGKALRDLRDQGVMILGSGSPFHNMNALRDGDTGKQACHEFNQWLIATCCDCEANEAEARLLNWQDGPAARYAHPREEHLLPLHVCIGSSIGSDCPAHCVFNADVMGYRMSAFLWDR